MRDRIELIGIEALGYHGVFPGEKRDGQIFKVDLFLELLSSKAGKSDDLKDAVDYSKVVTMVHEAIVGEPYDLIEKLAEVIASKVLKNFAVRSVEVVVHKPDAPVEVTLSDIAIRIKRKR
jgi:dihydroneopterin aldolase